MPDPTNAIYNDIDIFQDGMVVMSETMSFPSGNYAVTLSGTILSDCNIMIFANDEPIYSQAVQGDMNYRDILLCYTLPRRTSSYKIIFEGIDEADINISSINFASDHPLNNDSKAKAALVFLTLMAVLLSINLLIIGVINKNQLIVFIVLLMFSIFASSPLMSKYLIYGHDLRCHCGRIDGIRNAIMDKQTIPLIIPDAFNGFGVLLFEYPWLFLLIPVFLRFNELSMVLSYEIFLFIINISTAFVCYVSVKSVLISITKKSRENCIIIPLICSVFYTLSTYRLSDVYIRAAMGEMLAMIFLPLFAAGVYHLCAGDQSKWWILVVALTGILQSHILSCILIIPLAIILIIPFYKKIYVEKRWIYFIYSAGLFLILNLWYIIPFIKFLLLPLNTDEFTQYWVINNIVHLKTLFLSAVHNGFADDDRFTPSLGLCALACIIIIFLTFIKEIYVRRFLKKQTDDSISNRLLISCVSGIILFIIISSEIIPWNFLEAHFPHIWKCINMIQFPYRFLTVAMVCIVFGLAISLQKISEDANLSKSLIPIMAIILTVSLYDSSTLMDDYMNCGWITFKTYSGGFIAYTPKDYLPAGINTNCFNDKTPLISSGEITEYIKSGTNITLSYTSDTNAVATVPLNYYPCYRAVLDSGESIPLSAWADKRMLMTLPSGEHTVNIHVIFSR